MDGTLPGVSQSRKASLDIGVGAGWMIRPRPLRDLAREKRRNQKTVIGGDLPVDAASWEQLWQPMLDSAPCCCMSPPLLGCVDGV